EIVEMQRVFGQSLMQRCATLDVALDVEYQLLHGGLFMPRANDFECLHHGYARGEHGGELAAEYRNILGLDPAALGSCHALLLDAGGGDSLASQFGFKRLFAGRDATALDPLT